MGYFMTAYDLFNPVRSLAIAGIPVAVSKMVSEAVATGHFADARRTFRAALGLMCVTGALGTLGVLAFGGHFAALAGNPGAAAAVLSIAPAIFCCCMISVYRGYYEGQRNMVPTAISQVFEALIRLSCGIGFAGAAYTMGLESYTRDGIVFGVYAGGPLAAETLLAQFTAAAAIWGVSVSTLASMIFLMARHTFVGPDPRIRTAESSGGQSYGVLLRELVRTAVPVCLGSLAVSMGALVDLFTVMNRLGDAVAAAPGYFAAKYAAVLASGQTLEQLPNYLYGSYTGLALDHLRHCTGGNNGVRYQCPAQCGSSLEGTGPGADTSEYFGGAAHRLDPGNAGRHRNPAAQPPHSGAVLCWAAAGDSGGGSAPLTSGDCGDFRFADQPHQQYAAGHRTDGSPGEAHADGGLHQAGLQP